MTKGSSATQETMETALRWTAIAIAVAAIVDPSVTVSGHVKPRLGVAVENGPSLDLPSVGDRYSRRDVARGVVEQLTRDLGQTFEFADASASAIIVVGDRYPLDIGASSIPISTVSLSTPGGVTPNVRLTSVAAPAAVPQGTAVRIEAALEASGVRGATTTVVIQTGGFEVGRVSHTWSTDREVWNMGVDVVPVGAAPFVFQIAAAPLPTELTPVDNAATVRVGLAPAIRVLVFEARPSWSAAFVRRALESDARFQVSQIGRMSPTALVVSGGTRSLSDEILADIDALVVGGLDALTADDIAKSDRFVRERGGALALVPDSAAGLAPLRGPFALPDTRELLVERHAALATRAPLPRVDASEMLAPAALASETEVLARTSAPGEPVIWTAPRGAGRILFSGAMDAWRFRSEPQVEFDRFWRSAIAGLALAARPPISLKVLPGRLIVSLADRLADDAKVSGTTRLFPAEGRGEFYGLLDSDAASKDAIAVAISSHGITHEQRVSPEPPTSGVLVDPPGPPLAMLASTHGGIDVSPEKLADLERFLRSAPTGPSALVERRPMHSIVWMIPFAACLSGEWWLRRRRGLR
jgi:hypothetical protein